MLLTLKRASGSVRGWVSVSLSVLCLPVLLLHLFSHKTLQVFFLGGELCLIYLPLSLKGADCLVGHHDSLGTWWHLVYRIDQRVSLWVSEFLTLRPGWRENDRLYTAWQPTCVKSLTEIMVCNMRLMEKGSDDNKQSMTWSVQYGPFWLYSKYKDRNNDHVVDMI